MTDEKLPLKSLAENEPMQEELRITGVRKHQKIILKNVADHLGTSVSHLLKIHLEEIIRKYPTAYQSPFKKD